MSVLRASLFVLAVYGLPSASFGGTVRYDLPELLGEHRYDGTTYTGGFAQVDTPYGFYTVQQARLVIAGSVQVGKARGDGIIREPLEFDLEPFVQAGASFKRTYVLGVTPTIGQFTIDEIHASPFVPETTPLPNPDGYPPISFTVGLGLTLSFSTNIPPKIHPNSPYYDATDGVIVYVPIIANVTTAYIEFSGPGVVPEPSTRTFLLLGCMFCRACKDWRNHRLTSRCS